MREAGRWIQEGFFRVLGKLSALSHALRELRWGIPLSWVVFPGLVVGALLGGLRGVEAIRISQIPLLQVHEVAEVSLPDERLRRVGGQIYRHSGFEIGYESADGDSRQVLYSYFLLLDATTGKAVFVRTEGRLQKDGQPYLGVVTGRVQEMENKLRVETAKDEWRSLDIDLVRRRVLREIEPPGIALNLAVFFLSVLGIGFLLVTRWFDYVIFRARSSGAPGRPQDQGPDLAREVGLRATACLPVTGGRRNRVQLVEASTELEQTEDGWLVVAHNARTLRTYGIPLPANSIEEITPGKVYFRSPPRWGLWLIYRDGSGSRRRLCLSFDRPEQRWAVYDALALWARSVHRGPTAAEES
jgi:hypothetical protein